MDCILGQWEQMVYRNDKKSSNRRNPNTHSRRFSQPFSTISSYASSDRRNSIRR